MKIISDRTIRILLFSCLLTFTGLSVKGIQINIDDSLKMDTISSYATHLQILTWNIGILPSLSLFKERDDRAQAIANALRCTDYDIIVFQEAFTIYARNVIGQSLHDQYPYAYGPVNKSMLSLKVNSGIWILSKIPLKIRKEIEFTGSAGMDGFARKGAVLLDGLFYGAPFQLIATHLQDDAYPQVIREQQLTEIHEKLIKPYSQVDTPQIICGDFNTDEKMVENYKGMLSILDAEDGSIDGTIKITFDDISNDEFKSLHPDPRRIDYVLTRNSQLISWIKEKVAVLKSRWGENKEYLSDHHGLEAVIEFKPGDYLTKVFK
jgi:endonuclease/exonuclease/phosphatase family metal-dependent hydrolase